MKSPPQPTYVYDGRGLGVRKQKELVHPRLEEREVGTHLVLCDLGVQCVTSLPTTDVHLPGL